MAVIRWLNGKRMRDRVFRREILSVCMRVGRMELHFIDPREGRCKG